MLRYLKRVAVRKRGGGPSRRHTRRHDLRSSGRGLRPSTALRRTAGCGNGCSRRRWAATAKGERCWAAERSARTIADGHGGELVARGDAGLGCELELVVRLTLHLTLCNPTHQRWWSITLTSRRRTPPLTPAACTVRSVCGCVCVCVCVRVDGSWPQPAAFEFERCGVGGEGAWRVPRWWRSAWAPATGWSAPWR